MFLFSPTLLRLFKFVIDYANFFHALPFKWNQKSGLIDYVEPTKRNYLRNWNFVKYVTLAYFAFIIIRIFQSASELTLEKFNVFVLETLVLIGFTEVSVLQMLTMYQGRAMITCVNRFLKYFETLQGKL